MTTRSRLPLPRALKMPLRDILRGVATAADVTEEVLEPATALLPGAVQTPFRSALAAFEQAGSRAVTPTIDASDIAVAKDYLKGVDQSRNALETFVSVLAFVWERALSRHGNHQLLFSETVAAASLAVGAGGDDKTSYARAAAILTRLKKANAASRVPGTPVALSEEEGVYVDKTWLSASVWLLSERAPNLTDDIRLLELAMALTEALENDVIIAMADEVLLIETMQSLAEHL
ncbi:MAG: hypothetical protein AAGA21_04960 [Pseudomonadota bacterium]